MTWEKFNLEKKLDEAAQPWLQDVLAASFTDKIVQHYYYLWNNTPFTN